MNLGLIFDYIWDEFGMNSVWILMNLGWILDEIWWILASVPLNVRYISGDKFADHRSRRPRNIWQSRFQVTKRTRPKTAKNQHRTRHKNGILKTQSWNLQFRTQPTANKRTPRDTNLKITIRRKQSTETNAVHKTAPSQNGGRRCHAAWRLQMNKFSNRVLHCP